MEGWDGDLLTAVVDASDDAIVGTSLDGVIRSWNRGAERLFGYATAEVIGRPVRLFDPPAPAGVERIEDHEMWGVRRDGERVRVRLTVSPIRDAAGRVVGALTLVRDLTEGWRTELAAQRLAAIVESSDDAIVGKTLDGIIVSWNGAAERLYQYTAAEALGRHIDLLAPPDRPQEMADILARLRRGERLDHFETERIRKDGTRVHVSVTISPVRNAAGEIIGASAIARDIGDRRRLEEEQTRLLEQEREMHVATQRARRAAEDASRAKDEFLAMVSHELRTPLNAVTGWLHVLRAKRDDPALVDRALDAADRNTRWLTRIVDDLLDVSRFVAGQIAVDRHPVDILPVVETVLDAMRRPAQEKGVVLQSSIDPWTGPVLADAERLHQILGNIVGNAIKFTPSGGRVDVRAWNEGSHATIVVTDTGQGIHPDFLPHVFEAFRQADPSSARSHGGLGLGLAIVRHLVALHDGTVTAESPGVGKGARVTLRLPVLKHPLIGHVL
ncbi:MAG: PAS domain S-box protein [Candidatus Rokuibacteriota bacterium]